jgi:hypothetical protein
MMDHGGWYRCQEIHTLSKALDSISTSFSILSGRDRRGETLSSFLLIQRFTLLSITSKLQVATKIVCRLGREVLVVVESSEFTHF